MTLQDHSLDGKTMLVTGATAGIGEITALELARRGAAVILVSRSPEKCAATAERIRGETDNPNIDFFVADLSSQAQIRQAAAQFKARYDRLDVLVNNAGGVFARRKLSVDGIEMNFALNHLSYFLLTNLLLDVLKASAPARIVNVSSNGHFDSAPDFADLQFEKNYAMLKAYGRSKFANVLFTYELARRLDGNGVTANALNPGLVKTRIGTNSGWLVGLAWNLVNWLRNGLTPEEGAQTSILLASSVQLEGVTGKYYSRQKERASDPVTYDEELARHLWEISAQMVGL